MTVIWHKDWNNLTVPSWIELYSKSNMTIQDGWLLCTGNIGAQGAVGRTRVYTKSDAPIPDEYWIQTELMIPADDNVQNWNVIMEPISDHPTPYETCNIERNGVNNLIDIDYKNVSAVPPTHFQRENDVFLIQNGVPFTVKIHVIYHETNGLIDIWINENLVFHYIGKTKWSPDSYKLIILVDNYKGADEDWSTVMQRYVTIATEEVDLDFTTQGPVIEPPPPGPFTMEVKPCIVTAAGAPLALLTGLRVITVSYTHLTLPTILLV